LVGLKVGFVRTQQGRSQTLAAIGAGRLEQQSSGIPGQTGDTSHERKVTLISVLPPVNGNCSIVVGLQTHNLEREKNGTTLI